MPISLLYKNSAKQAEFDTANYSVQSAIYNLNIDKIAASACVNSKTADYFLKTIARPLTDADEIKYRREILDDFLKTPEILADLLQLFRSFDTLRDETKEMTDGVFKYGSPTSVSDLLDCTYEQLYINCHFARNVIAYFSEIYDCFCRHDIVASEGLLAMKNYCKKMMEDASIYRLEQVAEQFKNESAEKYSFSISLAFNDILQTEIASICDVKDSTVPEKKRIFSTIFKKKPEIPNEINIGSAAADNAVKLVIESMSELSSLFWEISSAIYETFFGISCELLFYSAACDIAKYITSAGMHYCFPTVFPHETPSNCTPNQPTDASTFSADNLYDLLLVHEGKKREEIVTNSIKLPHPCHGILVRGDNNCGKTSFLRAVGSAVIFAQNGLFVCAESLTMFAKTGVFSHFSSAEKDGGDEAGRFEGEVKEIVKIIDEITPKSLLLLNETFQTTAYKEGAIGMKDILLALGEIDIFYIFVTHMQTMFDIIDDQNVLKLMTGEGEKKYKLIDYLP